MVLVDVITIVVVLVVLVVVVVVKGIVIVIVVIVIVNAARIPPRPDQGPRSCDRQPAMGSKLHKTTDLLISQLFYRQSCV